MGKFIDETGNRYGRLVAIRRCGQQNGHVQWLCKCDCGNETVVEGVNLRSGITKSCSCLQKDTAGKLTKEEVGNRHGRLTVISRSGSMCGIATWLCKCDCGKEVVVQGINLRSGNSTSCGCFEKEKKKGKNDWVWSRT